MPNRLTCLPTCARLMLMTSLTLSMFGLAPAGRHPVIAHTGFAPLLQPAAPNLTLNARTATGSDDQITNGDTVTFTLTFSNPTQNPIRSVVITVGRLPSALQNDVRCSGPSTCKETVEPVPFPNPLGETYTVLVKTAVVFTLTHVAANSETTVAFTARLLGQADNTELAVTAFADYSLDGVNALPTPAISRILLARADVLGNDTRFATWRSTEAGGAFSQDWGDLDRDGDLDLVLGTLLGVEVYRNDGNTLVRIKQAERNRRAYSVKWADLDSDGTLELVEAGSTGAGDQEKGFIAIYKKALNQDVFNEVSPAPVTPGFPVGRLVIMNADKDNKLDLIASTLNYSPTHAVAVFTNTSTAPSLFSFSPITYLPVPSTAAMDVVYLGGVPNLTLAPLGSPIQIQTHVPSASGLVTTPTVVAASLPSTPYDLAWGDYDRNGVPDLAAAFPLQNEVRIYLGTLLDKVYSWVALTQTLQTNASLAPLSVDWADMDGDGDLDLLVGDDPPRLFRYNAQKPTFEEANNFKFDKVPGQTWSLRGVRALPGGDMALVATDLYNPSLLFSTLQPRLSTATATAFGPVSGTNSLALGDLDGDDNRRLDVLVGANPPAKLINTGAGFNQPADLESAGSGSFRVALGDLNRKGNLDILVAGRSSVLVYLDGISGPHKNLTPPLGSRDLVAALGDGDGDARLDAALGGSDGAVYVYTNTQLLSALTETPVFTHVQQGPVQSLVWADIDQDFYLDLLVLRGATRTCAYVYLLRNTGNQTSPNAMFTPVWQTPVCGATALAVGDADADGWPELAVGFDDRVEVYAANRPARTFANAPALTVMLNAGPVTSLAWGDWNNDEDGLPELAVGSALGLRVLANLNSQPGRLRMAQAWATPPVAVTDLAWGDLNNDGFLDLVATQANAASLVFTNTSLSMARLLTPPVISLHRPGRVADAFGSSSSELLGATYPPAAAASVPFTYTVWRESLLAPGGTGTFAVAQQTRSGEWKPASLDVTPVFTAKDPTLTTTLQVANWKVDADKSTDDDARLRLTFVPNDPLGSPDVPLGRAFSPPAQTHGTRCGWPSYAAIRGVSTVARPVTSHPLTATLRTTIGGIGSVNYVWQLPDGVTDTGEWIVRQFTRTTPITLTVTPKNCDAARSSVATMVLTVAAAQSPAPGGFAAQTIAAPESIAPVTELQGDWAATGHTLRLAWPPVDGATGYHVYRHELAQGAIGRIASVSAPRLETLAQCGSSYSVTAYNAAGESRPSANSFVTAACAELDAPENTVTTTSAPVAVAQPLQSVGAGLAPAPVRTIGAGASPTPTEKDIAAVQGGPVWFAPVSSLALAPTINLTAGSACLYLPVVSKMINSAAFQSHTDVDLTQETERSRDALQRVSTSLSPETCIAFPSFTLNEGIVLDAAVSASGCTAAYISNNTQLGNSDRNPELFITTTVETPALTGITTTGNIFGGFNLAPSMSHSGTRVAFLSDRPLGYTETNTLFANFEVYVAEPNASGPLTITKVTTTRIAANSAPSISADGNAVAFVSNAASDDFGVAACSNCTNPNRRSNVFVAMLGSSGTVTLSQVTLNNDNNISYAFPQVSDAVSGTARTVAFLMRDATTGSHTLLRGFANRVGCLGSIGPAQHERFGMTRDGGTLVYVAGDASAAVISWTPVASNRLTNSNAASQPSVSDDGQQVTFVRTNTLVLHKKGQSDSIVKGLPTSAKAGITADGKSFFTLTGTQLSVRKLPEIKLEVTSTLTTATAGKPFTMTYTVANIGGLTLTPTLVVAGPDVDGNPILGSLAPGDVAPGVITFDLASGSAITTHTANFTLTANAGNDVSWAVTKTQTITTPVQRLVDLAVTLDVPDTATAGVDLPVTIMVTNKGPSDQLGNKASLVYTLPNEIHCGWVTSTPSTVCAGSVLSWTFDSLTRETNLQRMLTINVPATQTAGVTLTHAAQVKFISNLDTNLDQDVSDNSISKATETKRDVNLVLGLSYSPDPAVAGGQVMLTAKVTNTGQSQASNVQLTATLLSGFKATKDCDDLAKGVSCPADEFTFNSDPALRNFTVTLQASEAGATPVITTVTVPLVGRSDLSILLSAPTPAFIDTRLPVMLTVRNAGPSTAQNAKVVYTLPGGVSCSEVMSSTANNPTCKDGANGANTTVTWIVASLAVNSFVELAASLAVGADDFGTWRHEASVMLPDGEDTNSANNTASAQTFIPRPLTSVDIVAQVGGDVTVSPQIKPGQSIVLTANAMPTSAPLVTYLWAYSLTPTPVGNPSANPQTLRWPNATPGQSIVITVTASNPANVSVSKALTVTIVSP